MHATRIQAGFVARLPCWQGFRKSGFATVFEYQSEFFKLLCSFIFHLAGQVTVDNGDLMEMTHLHGNVGKKGRQTAQTVASNALDAYAFFPKLRHGFPVKHFLFNTDFLRKNSFLPFAS